MGLNPKFVLYQIKAVHRNTSWKKHFWMGGKVGLLGDFHVSRDPRRALLLAGVRNKAQCAAGSTTTQLEGAY